jgi:hypothetical protein
MEGLSGKFGRRVNPHKLNGSFFNEAAAFFVKNPSPQ